MTVLFQIPRVLQQYAQGSGEFPLEAATVGEALQQLKVRHASLYRCLCEETGRLRPHVNLFVNEAIVTKRDDLQAARLSPGDIVSVFQAVSGG